MRKIIAALFISSALLSSEAVAAKAVVEVGAQLAKSAISAAQNQQQTAQLIVSNMHQYNQYLTMLQNLRNLSPTQVATVIKRGVDTGYITNTNPQAALNEAMGVYSNYGQLTQTMTDMTGVYGRLNAQTEKIDRLAVTSGLSWEEILTTEREAAKKGQVNAAQNYLNLQQLMGQLGNFQQRADTLANRVPLNQGTMEAMGTLSAQNHLITDQLSGLLQANIATAQSATRGMQKEAQSEQTKADIKKQALQSEAKIRETFGY